MENLLIAEKKTQIDKIKNKLDHIEYGENSQNVQKVQEVLLDNGYYKGNIDGIYGPLTDQAIQQIKEDGLIQPANKKADSSAGNQPENKVKKQASTTSEQSSSEKTSPKPASKKEKKIRHVETNNPSTNIIQAAKSHLGTPYVWGGTSPNGFDCSGFIQFVYEEDDITIPRTVREIWNFAAPISSPSIGDLVFFETYQAGPSHMGIYLGNGDFIHAGSSEGVTISNMENNEYWQTKYLGAKRI